MRSRFPTPHPDSSNAPTGVGKVLSDRRLRSPPDHWGRTSVTWRTSQSSAHMYVPDPSPPLQPVHLLAVPTRRRRDEHVAPASRPGSGLSVVTAGSTAKHSCLQTPASPHPRGSALVMPRSSWEDSLHEPHRSHCQPPRSHLPGPGAPSADHHLLRPPQGLPRVAQFWSAATHAGRLPARSSGQATLGAAVHGVLGTCDCRATTPPLRHLSVSHIGRPDSWPGDVDR